MSLIASSHLIVVVGLGVTGLSVARFLRHQQKSFVLMDSRAVPPNMDIIRREFSEYRCITGGLDTDLLLQASEIIVSPGISIKTPAIVAAINAGIPVIGDIELFARHVNVPVIAITGSNAKSTVTTLVGDMAKQANIHVAVGGNIGKPVLDLLLNDTGIELYVLELSSFQLEVTSSLKAIAASVLNVCHDHMDRYDSFAQYHLAKQRVYWGATTIVINRDDPLTQPPVAQGVQVISFGFGPSDKQGFGLMTIDGQEQLAFQFKPLLPVTALALKGRHNIANALAALALGHAAGIAIEPMLEVLTTFAGLEHRCQHVRTLNQIDYVNDSKATNVGATLAAINGFSRGDKNIILVAGGQAKEADFSPLLDVLEQSVRAVIVMGEDAGQIATVIGDRLPCHVVGTMLDAVKKANDVAVIGDTVLLSPACASFDQYSGFKARGEHFIDIVMGLAP